MTTTSSRDFAYLPRILNGGFAGIVGVSCVFPIDLVKTRLQNQQIGADGRATYNGIIDCAQKTWKSGGSNTISKVRALYAGSAVNILLITPEKAIKLVANDFFRHKLSTGERQLSTIRGMIAGGCAGFCQIIITTPMELLKIQMQDAGRTAGTTGQPKLTATQLTMNLLREKGIAGLYRGLGSTMARDVTFSVIYFPLFAKLDSFGPRKADGSGDAVFWSSFAAGIISGGTACFAVTPLDVIKTRLQLIKRGAGETEYRGMSDAVLSILRNEGWRALFKGAACRMMVVAPLFGIAQTVYFIGVAEWVLGIQKQAHV